MGAIEKLNQIAALLWRPTLAHMIAVTVIGYTITAGVVILEHGMAGISLAAGIGPNFLAALLVLAAASLPIGLLLRYLCEKLPVPPFLCVMCIGGLFGLSIIPLMHPELTDGRIVMAQHGPKLLGIHGLAGLLGGVLWWLVEFRILRRASR